jgi:predicted peroxiredoxin
MQFGRDKLVIMITEGIESELSSVAFTIANGGLSAGLQVFIFLTRAGVDLVRKNGQRLTHVAPLHPLAKSIEDFQRHGGVIWACTPSVQSRGYRQADLLEGVIVTGASVLDEQVKQSAAILSF